MPVLPPLCHEGVLGINSMSHMVTVALTSVAGRFLHCLHVLSVGLQCQFYTTHVVRFYTVGVQQFSPLLNNQSQTLNLPVEWLLGVGREFVYIGCNIQFPSNAKKRRKTKKARVLDTLLSKSTFTPRQREREVLSEEGSLLNLLCTYCLPKK